MKFHTHRFRIAKTIATTTASFDSANIEHYLSTEANAQACNRCRRLKKRCSKTPPECELCVSAGHTCSFGQLAARQATLVNTPKDAQDAENSSVNSCSPDENRMQAPSTCNAERRAHDAATASTFDGTYLSYVHAYFRHVHRAYPFLDRQEILSNAKASTYLNVWADNPDSIVSAPACRHILSNPIKILGLVLSIGSTTLERAGKLSTYDRPQMVVPYARILSGCLLSPSMKGLQILTLLSLYSLFDPNGISTWSIVGILTRQAVTLGLSRRNTSQETLSPHAEELRHRLFWSILVLDRMLAVSVGHPPGLIDENMNIPQPAVTVEEFASSERVENASLLQLNRHIIQLRQLELQILTAVHTRGESDISKMSNADRAAISNQLRTAIDDWYSLGCLVCLPEADNIPIHSTITWLNARYYNLLILLYYPCHFNSPAKHSSIGEIVGYIRQYFKYNYILLENKQLPLNYITLNRLIPACLVLMYCFGALQPSSFSAKVELGNCVGILHTFPETWLSAHQAASIVTEFLSVVSSHESYAATHPIPCTKQNATSLAPTAKIVLQKLMTDLSGVTARALSPTSCYLSLCTWEDSASASAVLSSTAEPASEDNIGQLNMWGLSNDYDFGFL